MEKDVVTIDVNIQRFIQSYTSQDSKDALSPVDHANRFFSKTIDLTNNSFKPKFSTKNKVAFAEKQKFMQATSKSSQASYSNTPVNRTITTSNGQRGKYLRIYDKPLFRIPHHRPTQHCLTKRSHGCTWCAKK